MRKSLRVFAIAAAIVATSVVFSGLRASGGFTLGNLVVYRVGDGAASLGSAATAVFLDEYTTAGALVQSIPMPTVVNGTQKRLTASGSATTEGFLTLSADGRYLVLTGYDAAVGTASITTSASASVNRVVGRVDAAGVLDTSTGTLAISGGNPRGVASDAGANFWIAGSVGGVQLATFGNSAVTPISTTQTNLREANIFGGQLYLSTGAGTAYRIGAVGSGLPTTSGQTTTSLPGLPTSTGSSNGFFFADLDAGVAGLDTLYVADDVANQLQKYSLVGGTWVSNGALPVSGARGLTATVTGTTVSLFGTAGSSGTTLYTFTDSSGYNAAIAGTTTTIATVAANRAFRGVALTPTNSTPPPPPTPTDPTGVGSAAPASVQAGATTLLTVTVTPGTNPTSTVLAVTADLGAIGGSAAQVFFDDGTNGDLFAGDKVFSFRATVSASTGTGLKTLPATIADTTPGTPVRTGSASIAVTVTAASTSPTGAGSATPNSLRVGNAALLTVMVTPGSNPVSTGLTVIGDLGSIGGSASQAFFDDGTHGDVSPGNNVFSYSAFIPVGTAIGAKSLPITVSDGQGRSSSTAILVTVKPPPPPTTIKISQVYGGGGNSGATYTNDFVELFNIGTTPVDITGWSVQYSSSGASTWTGGGGGNLTRLCPSGPCVIEAGHYFLVQESAGAGGTTAPPAADVAGTIQLAAGAAKIALVASIDPLTGACPIDDSIVDFVGYGGANCAETTPAASLSATLAAVRRANGCVDTNNNANDFVAIGPIPRNSASPSYTCGGSPSQPSGIGIGIPSSIEPAADTLLTVQVSPAVTPPSTTFTVIADLTSVGGLATQQLFDDGTHGDLTAGDRVFSFLALMPATLTTGAKNIVTTIMDAEGRTVTAPITLTIVSPTCGVERWSVKVGTDGTVGLVNLTPYIPATIEALGLVTPPSSVDIDTGGVFAAARSAPVETSVYTVDATMTFYKKEADVDYHIVLDDGNGHTLISEIPSPACIITSATPRVLVPSPLAAGIALARTKFDARLSATSFFQNAGIPVRVSGVGFFDFEHGQTGVAPNAIELHPVLDISFRGFTGTALTSNENPSVYGDTIQLTATVTGGDGTIVPTGNVVFFDAGNSFTAVLDANGQARYTTNQLTAGTHTITAGYGGDDTSVPSTAAPFLQVVGKADQLIDFAALTDRVFGQPDFTVSGGASSGLAVTFTIASGPATIAGNVVHITGLGSVTVRASQGGDSNYNPAPDVTRTFQVLDGTPPTIVSVTPSVTSIWPPSTRMVPVSFTVKVTDDIDPAPSCQVAGVTSNEGSSSDWQITGPASVNLRADRSGAGSGRIYVITVRCTDASGNVSTASATVTVPHDQGD
jgi:hypothetical protein